MALRGKSATGAVLLSGHVWPLSNPNRVKQWLAAVRRNEKWRPTRHSVVCKRHFDEDDYEKKTTYGTKPLITMLRPTAVPHIFAWSKETTPAQSARRERVKKKLDMEEKQNQQRDAAFSDVGAQMEISTERNIPDVPYREDCTQTDAIETKTTGTQSEPPSRFTAKWFMNDREGLHFYTGLGNYNTFMFVLSLLGAAAYELRYYGDVIHSLSIEDQFLLTLMKLRRNQTHFELSRDGLPRGYRCERVATANRKGASKYVVSKGQLELLIACRFSMKKMGEMLNVSTKTVKRRMMKV
ncbi:PREDICTED: uncharacterized protein LOC106811639 [Priapulus caudatus]|uniref:Uncharacterized protein LOC106811639 n=1 Tax=Priapulus caudatus TaxID=37621 RepID=A0ABM1EF56_PRICU|nr:PREDICTED: uncharacterized protein LOC106811639 [Priapulus caudatus]